MLDRLSGITQPSNKPVRYAIYNRESLDGLFDFSSCRAQFLLCQEHIRHAGEPSLT